MFKSAPSSETTLVIRHLAGVDPSFQIMRLSDGKTSQPVPLNSPIGFPVEGRPNSNLMQELQWYLEEFLDYPFPPNTDRADRVIKALRSWGEQAFEQLFGDRSAGRMFEAITAEDYSSLHLQISSDDPRILVWPWEALRDPELGFLAHTCQVERRLNKTRDPQKLPRSLPRDCVNILLVVARPYGDQDVSFRSIARLLVELIEKEKLPAHVELLRPPTFAQLRRHLQERSGFYHILHFDGHGVYSKTSPITSSYTFQGPEGKLVFETDDGGPDAVTAEKLSALLRENAVPGVVLNACQSAMVGEDSDNAFNSVAMALLRSGMRDVVAMSYSLYVSGAQQFLPAFYRRLFEEGSMSVAVRAGRQSMWQHDQRICVRGEFPLQDWLLPVLYQQDPLNFSFASQAKWKAAPRESKLPQELHRAKNPYGFIGRDSAILAMERAMRRAPAGILIQGLGGIGKTTLARGFLQWLDQTGGLENPPFWFGFQEIHSAEFVFNRMGEALFGTAFATLANEKKIEELGEVMRERRFFIVWDNFESVAGIPGTSIEANLSESDRLLLVQFLDELRSGATKVIITSRSPEEWIGPARRFLLPLGGLDREERWEYCDAILRDLGLQINRSDKNLKDLMDLLRGHPLAMRTILPRLEKLCAATVAAAVRSNLESLRADSDLEQATLYATLVFVEQSLPQELQPLLVLLALHEGFVDAQCIEGIYKEVDTSWSREKINALLHALVSAGLLRHIAQLTYQMHPLLTSYLRSVYLKKISRDNLEPWIRSFVNIMASMAEQVARLKLHEQFVPFQLHGQNFYFALTEAERLQMPQHIVAISHSLGIYAHNSRNFNTATSMFEHLAACATSSGDLSGEAAAYYQLGLVAQEKENLQEAENWYKKSLIILERLGTDDGLSPIYHQLGTVAQQRYDVESAAEYYKKALALKKCGEDDGTVAATYHQLGMIAQGRRDFKAASEWYEKSLRTTEKHGDEHGAAKTYHQLAKIAFEERDLKTAEELCGRSLTIFEQKGDQNEVSASYQGMGMIAQVRRDFKAAEAWYGKSLSIKEKQGDMRGAANTYHSLGRMAQEQLDFTMAEQWLIKSLAIATELRDEHLIALSCFELGANAHQQHDFPVAEEWYGRSRVVFERLGDAHALACIYAQLGALEMARKRFVESGNFLIDSIIAFIRTNDLTYAKSAASLFMNVWKDAPTDDQKKLLTSWQEAGLGELPHM